MHGRCAVRTTTRKGTGRAVDLRRMRRPPTHPGEMLLEEFLKPLGLSQAEAAALMQMTANRLNEIVKGKRGVTADTAWRLSTLLGTSPEVWMNLQMHWDLWHAAQARRTA
ncbi:MAG: HigA family addiction module antidote protein [Vicinamibacteria bacterium]|nr:HigA family addiction module antidote protein [Vicinamibacteria bacterium]